MGGTPHWRRGHLAWAAITALATTRAARMFGLFDGGKYRTEVIVQIHAILKLVPELKRLLETLPNLKGAINEFREAKTPEIEAAAWLSLVVIEKAMLSVPPDRRLLALQYLHEKKEDGFRWFARCAQAIMANQEPERPRGMPKLAVVLGFAFWYLGVAVRENKLSETCYQNFVRDVVGMLRGKS
jgi:hypothetical protein